MQDKYRELISFLKSQWQIESLSAGLALNQNYQTFSFSNANSLANNPHMVYRIGSLTKAFTATLLGTLVDEGLISWPDKVVGHLPKFMLIDFPHTQSVTVEQLLTHTTGVKSGIDSFLAVLGYTHRQILNKLKLLEVYDNTNVLFQYSNVMYSVVGELIKKITKTKWENYLSQKIFVPLQMTHSSTGYKQLLLSKNKSLLFPGIVNPVDHMSAAGAINSSISDLLSWLKFNLATSSENAILKPSTLEYIHTQKVAISNLSYGSSIDNFIKITGYALGWMNAEILGLPMLMHEGGMPGYSSLMVLIPTLNFGFIALANASKAQPALFSLLLTFLSDIMGFQRENFAKLIFDEVGHIKVQSDEKISRLNKSLKSYGGVYTNDLFDKAEIVEIAKVLYLRIGNRFNKLKLLYLGNNKFKFDADYHTLASFADSYLKFDNNKKSFHLIVQINTPRGERLELGCYEFNKQT